jgi:hypothetical protein
VAYQVEVGVFLSLQVGKPFGELRSDAGLGAVPVGHGGLGLAWPCGRLVGGH